MKIYRVTITDEDEEEYKLGYFDIYEKAHSSVLNWLEKEYPEENYSYTNMEYTTMNHLKFDIGRIVINDTHIYEYETQIEEIEVL